MEFHNLGFSAELISEYIELTKTFTAALTETLLPGIQALFGAIVGLWVLIGALRVALGTLDLQKIAIEFIYVTIAYVLLFGSAAGLIHEAFVAALDVMGGAASIAINIGNIFGHQTYVPDGVNGLVALAAAAEDGVIAVVIQAVTLMDGSTWGYWPPLFYGLALIAPFLILLLGYLSILVVSIFRLVMIASISPFLMLGYGFGWGRGMAIEGFRLTLASIVVLFAATSAVGMVLFGVRVLDVGQGGSIDVAADLFDQNSYWLAVALGWAGTALLAEGTVIGNSIAKSSLDNSAAVTMVSGMITAPIVAYESYIDTDKPVEERFSERVKERIKKYREPGVDRSP